MKKKDNKIGTVGAVRTFNTGATRDMDENKFDYEGFLSSLALERFAEYMHKHRVQSDGRLRESDNWQKGMPVTRYMKSLWRHFMAVWRGHRSGGIGEEDLCALIFNAMGILHELMVKKPKNKSFLAGRNETEIVTAVYGEDGLTFPDQPIIPQADASFTEGKLPQ